MLYTIRKITCGAINMELRKMHETMTGRQRIRATFGFEKTDRAPIGYDANGGIDRCLKEMLGMEHESHEAFLELLVVDYRGISAPYTGPLAYGTPEDVRQNCTEILELMRPYGGYHFAPTHAIQDNSPVENVFEMYQTVYDYYR